MQCVTPLYTCVLVAVCDRPVYDLLQGLAFLDTVVELTRKRQWVGWDMDGEVKAWLSLLLMPVDITSQHAESNLKDFLTTKTGGATKQYREHIKREVRATRCYGVGGF